MTVNKHTLPNGLRVLLIPMPQHRTACVYVLVEAGSRDESTSIEGISHFLEHMCFKGTKMRPSSYDISKELEGLGSQSNAFTSYEYTGYYAKSHADHIHHILDIVSDIYLHPLLPTVEIEKEKGVIVEEINMYNDRPDHIAGEVYRAMMYSTSSLGKSIAGTIESVRSVTRESLALYHQEHYTTATTVVVVAGKFDENKVLADVTTAFKDAPQGIATLRAVPEKISEKSRIKITEKKSDQTHIVLGVPAYTSTHPKRTALSVLSTVLGGGMSSRLFQKLREEMGVAYYVYSYPTYGTDHGDFEIAAGVDKNRVKEVVKEIAGELKRLTTENVTDEELARVKEYMLGSLYLDLESSDAFASYYGGQEIMRRELESPEDKERKIRAVTVEDIKEVATELFTNRGLVASIVGPYKEIEGLEELLVL
jgi:predicted Zn-dependent peptidase